MTSSASSGSVSLNALRETDPELAAEAIVVEGDDLVGKLGVGLAQGVERPPQRAQDELPLLEERRLQRIQILLEADPHVPGAPLAVWGRRGQYGQYGRGGTGPSSGVSRLSGRASPGRGRRPGT